MYKEKTMNEYEEYLSHPTQELRNPPLASGSGDDAKQLGRMLADPMVNKEQLVNTMMGRPTLAAQRHGLGHSVQHNVRMSDAMDEYVSRAVKREGLHNLSEYIRLLVANDAKAHRDELVAA